MQVFKPWEGRDLRILDFPSVLDDTGSKLTFLGFPKDTNVDPTESPD